MRVVHVCRKPCSEGTVADNVLKHGCGALNIDACRVGTEQIITWSRSSSRHREGVTIGCSWSGDVSTASRMGRWPANLILEHRPECQQTGSVRGPGFARNRWKDGSKPFGGGAGHPYMSTPVEEQTAVWECEPDCPVRALDALGSTSVTGNRSQRSQDANVKNTAWFEANHASQEYPNETGTASRFFLQVGGRVSSPSKE